MRIMMLLKASKGSEAGVMPTPETAQMLAEMGKYNERLIQAGVLIDGAGLQESAKGARVRFTGPKVTVIDGPFAETKELLAGYWIIDVPSLADAIAWAKQVPPPHPGEDAEIELRPMHEIEDFENAPPEVIEQEKRFRSQQRGKSGAKATTAKKKSKPR